MPAIEAEKLYPAWLIAELRSDQAGETGAVAIYNGILAVTRNSELRAFAEHHRATEQEHFARINDLLPSNQHSRLLPLWRVAGYLTGLLPALFGANATYATIQAVETFVDHHYAQQIARLDSEYLFPAVREILNQCRLDEVSHRDEAGELLKEQPSVMLRLWCAMVGRGSSYAVALARVF
jgi:ubiquinone biosynthesis monooxygenase Coq7